MTAYKGNYDIFEKTREEQLKNQQKAFESNERARSHMQVSSLLQIIWDLSKHIHFLLLLSGLYYRFY